jgi:CBS domain-containing protein
MKIKAALRPLIITLNAEESLSTAARLMRENDLDALPVTGGDRVLIISQRNIIEAIADGIDPAAPVRLYASWDFSFACLEDDTFHAIDQMLDKGIPNLPVVDQDTIVGWVWIRDLLALEAWTWLAPRLVAKGSFVGKVPALDGTRSRLRFARPTTRIRGRTSRSRLL